MKFLALSLACVALANASDCLADEGCAFTPTLECKGGGGCSPRSAPIAQSLWLHDDDVQKPVLALCFDAGAGANCIQGPATVRQTVEHEKLSSAVLLNPAGLGGLPRKVLVTLAYSWTDTVQGRAVLYPVTGTKNAPIYLSAGECSGAG